MRQRLLPLLALSFNMGAPVPPPFKIHLGIEKAIEEDLKYWEKEFRRQRILGLLLVGGTIMGVISVLLLL